MMGELSATHRQGNDRQVQTKSGCFPTPTPSPFSPQNRVQTSIMTSFRVQLGKTAFKFYGEKRLLFIHLESGCGKNCCQFCQGAL
ncbi:hypothetical protein CEXT_710221 [Caerostris extrusa]|uniref:Uncharacterized protein n=1 Tax=Caerostris extrusa TaxID=172846 RepID=A0AAV4NV23_CAEEX|nr:hypothetical protein CEXT_710221 [Caerostris extrusa]